MIYLTPFDPVTLRAIAPSTDSGFSDLDQVRAVMGPGWKTSSDRLVVYDRAAFSDYPFLLTVPSARANMGSEPTNEEAE